MSNSVLIIGESGSGKSTSIQKLDPKSTFIINCVGKDLPFKGYKKSYTSFNKENPNGNLLNTNKSATIETTLNYINEKRKEIKTIIIDDFQYTMSFEFMDRAKEKGLN